MYVPCMAAVWRVCPSQRADGRTDVRTNEETNKHRRDHHDKPHLPCRCQSARRRTPSRCSPTTTVTGFFQQVPGPSPGEVGAGWIAVFLSKQLL